MKQKRGGYRGQCIKCGKWCLTKTNRLNQVCVWRHKCIDGHRTARAVNVQTPRRQCEQFVRTVIPAGTPELVVQKTIEEVMDRFGYATPDPVGASASE